MFKEQEFKMVNQAALLQLEAYALEQSGKTDDLELANKLLSKAANILVGSRPINFDLLHINNNS